MSALSGVRAVAAEWNMVTKCKVIRWVVVLEGELARR